MTIFDFLLPMMRKSVRSALKRGAKHHDRLVWAIIQANDAEDLEGLLP